MPMLAGPRGRVWLAANTSWYVFNFRGRLLTELLACGHEVTVLAPLDAYSERIQELGARYIRIELDNAGTNPFRDSAVVWTLRSLLRSEQPDVLLTFTPKINIYGAFAASMAGVPVVANVSGLGSGFLRGGWLGRLMSLLYRASVRRAQWVYFQNEDDRDLFIREDLVKPERTERLPGSGVDVERFAPRTATRTVNSPFTFLLVGRLLWDKGVGEFVAAAREVRAKYPHTQFICVGPLGARNITAIPREQIQQWEREGIIRYFPETDDIRAHYALADCVVLPSYREGTSRVLLEAASMAVPLIATNVPGCRDAIEDGVTGFLCKVRDAPDLAARMCRMLELSPDERGAMGAAGRQKVAREFDERIVITRYLERIRDVLENESARSR
jgi:glycosyltransferase involved in cell wall biosynthesis